MTAEVDARSEVSQVLEKPGLAYEDFARGGARVGDEISLPKGNEVDSDGGCNFSVRINGSDEVADDSVHVDPSREVELECFEIDAEPKLENGNDPKFCVYEEIGSVGHDLGKNLGESAFNCLVNDIKVKNNASDGDEKRGEDTETGSSEKVEEMAESEDAVCEAADDNCNYPEANCRENKHDVKIILDSNCIVGEFGELKSSIAHVDAFVPEQNGEAVDGDNHGNKLNASPNKNEESSLILDAKDLVLNGKHSVVGQAGDKEEELEQNLVTVPTIEVCVVSKREDVDGSISHGSEACLPAGQDQNGDPQFDETCAIENAIKMDIVGESLSGHALVLEKSSQDDKDPQEEDSLSDDKEDGLPSSPDEDLASNPSMSNDLVLNGQNILGESRQLENTNTAPSILMVGTVEINCKKVFPSLPFNNAAIKSYQIFPGVESLRFDLKVKSSPKSIHNPDSCRLQGTKIEAESVNGTIDEDTQSSCHSNDQENLNHASDVNEVESNGSTCQGVKVVDEIDLGSSFTHDAAGPVNVVSEVGSEPVYFARSPSYEEDTQSSCLSNDQGSINHASEVNEVESNGSSCQEVKVIDEIDSDLSLGTQCSTLDTPEPLNVVAEVGSGPFYFVRIPRYEDEFIREKKKHSQSLVDEKTRIRDSFRDQTQTTTAACKELGSDLSDAKSEARAARESLKLKRTEIETAQSMVNKATDAISIDDIGIRIKDMEYKIAHETLPLKEEKQLIRDIKQLTQLRDQLSLDAGKQGELQLALDQKREVEKRLTLLRKEMDLIKANILKADELTMPILKKYDETEKLNELQAQFEEANKIRQEAYVHLQCLKKPFDEKHKYFGKYKRDMDEAENLALRKDGEKLQAHVINQVETFIERWNNDDEFRKDYIRCNTRRTLRRLGTVDGRSLASDEELPPPVLNNVTKERAATDNLVSLGLTVEENKPAGEVETMKDDKKPAKGVKKKNQETETKNPVAAAPTSPDDQASVSGGVKLVDAKDSSGIDFAYTREKDRRSMEEDDLEKRAEELRKEEEAMRLKEEQLKLEEEKAKAEIALARKKRKAERAQARAAVRAQKEAEEKEKEKEKKARRKKKKSGGGGEAKTEADIEEEPAVSMETPADTQKQPEIAEKPKTTSTKSPHSTKQNKAKPTIPAPLRKRGKRKMETWMWILLLTAVIVLAVFFLGNGGYLRKLGMIKFSFQV